MVTAALRDKVVFNGVGELDESWYPLVQVTHEALVGYGIDPTSVQFDGEEHIVSPRFDETVSFDWWNSHGPARYLGGRARNRPLVRPH